jgi:hypothetical protein
MAPYPTDDTFAMRLGLLALNKGRSCRVSGQDGAKLSKLMRRRKTDSKKDDGQQRA